MLKETLPEQFHNSIEELNAYLCDSFGNSTRLDYGTGIIYEKIYSQINTVKPPYSGHPSDFSKVSTIERCPL